MTEVEMFAFLWVGLAGVGIGILIGFVLSPKR